MTQKLLPWIFLLTLLLLFGCGNHPSGKDGEGTDSLTTRTDSSARVSEAPAQSDTRPWIFEETGKGPADEPLTKISVWVDEKTYQVAKNVAGNANILEKNVWADYKIPAKAESACMAWWAGEGDVYYLIRKKGGFIVYHTVVSEGMDLEKEIIYEKVIDYSGMSR